MPYYKQPYLVYPIYMQKEKSSQQMQDLSIHTFIPMNPKDYQQYSEAKAISSITQLSTVLTSHISVPCEVSRQPTQCLPRHWYLTIMLIFSCINVDPVVPISKSNRFNTIQYLPELNNHLHLHPHTIIWASSLYPVTRSALMIKQAHPLWPMTSKVWSSPYEGYWYWISYMVSLHLLR